jgi:hypothetical protein
MGILINTSDFKNQDLYAKYYIPFSSNVCGSEEKLKGYIERYEKKYLIQLLGVELSKLFIADLVDQVPIDAIYLDIYNSIEEDLTTGDSAYSSFCGCDRKIICTNGMKSMILGFVFFEYMRDQPFSKDLTGVNRAEAENSRESLPTEWGLFEYYNESVSDYQQTQYYILLNKENYSSFNGINKGISSPI